MKVCKFGGSSLADAGQISKVMDIVLADPARRMVVVSAPGKRSKSDTKVTDLLIALADTALAKKDTTKPLKAVIDRYASIAKDLKLGDDIVKEIEKDIDLDADANETKKTLRSMNRVVECMEHEISVATTLGIIVEEEIMSLYNESVGICGYRPVYP